MSVRNIDAVDMLLFFPFGFQNNQWRAFYGKKKIYKKNIYLNDLCKPKVYDPLCFVIEEQSVS